MWPWTDRAPARFPARGRGWAIRRADLSVVLTSSEIQEDREAALRAGATWFVCKPTDGHRFRAEIQQLADRWAQATT